MFQNIDPLGQALARTRFEDHQRKVEQASGYTRQQSQTNEGTIIAAASSIKANRTQRANLHPARLSGR